MADRWDIFTLDDFDIKGKTVILRIDINSPLDPKSGRILDDHRIRSHLETIRDLDKSRLVIIAHQSRPGKNDFTTLEAHATRMTQLLNKKVEYIDGLFSSHVRDRIRHMGMGEKLLLENARFYSEETYLKGDQDMRKHKNTHIVQKLSSMADYFVHDAFAAAHRAQPTLVGFTETLPSMAGRVMEKELKDMGKAFESDLGPKIAILGGMKADDSIEVAKNMLEDEVMDKILMTGIAGNIFLMAAGYDLGDGNEKFLRSELTDYQDIVKDARSLLDKWGEKIKIPSDVVANDDGERKELELDDLPTKDPIFDIGIDTIIDYTKEIDQAELIVMNGPAGAFEIEEFSIGTTELFRAVAHSDAFSIVGGGHSTAVVKKLDIDEEIDHISTGGGSCINFLAGKPLDGVEALMKSKKRYSRHH